MAEYWKSTPKYWCKHCSTFVKDTKFERAQHEATGKHQGNLKRFLRDIQNGHERDEREKQRAKAEVDRLNKVVGGSGSSIQTTPPALSKKSSSTVPASQASVAERKKQLAQLVEMGVAIPEEFRGEMAAAGDWKVVSQKVVDEGSTDEPLSVGVRKRKHGGEEEEEEEAGETVVRRGWGSTTKRYPGDNQDGATDLDKLLSSVQPLKKEAATKILKEEETKPDSILKASSIITPANGGTAAASEKSLVKEEEQQQGRPAGPALADIPAEPEMPEVVFKKRKSKNPRTK